MDLLLDFIIVGLSMGIVYGLVALGISLIYSGLDIVHFAHGELYICLLYTSPSPRDATLSRMPSSA